MARRARVAGRAKGGLKAGAAVRNQLLRAALAYPGAWEDHPWGETVVKVGKKVFVFLGMSGKSFGMSCKLPDSFDAALSMFSFAAETGYGLGKAGWVTATFDAGEPVPVELMLSWIDESYRAIAPKKLVKDLAEKS
ncbi:MAG: MmcQ/YjbR family DNA-binding protein [Deltaproteobacteria bacterium]|nr:MAG: MmcQ/YjbR family DNA-binding protein [Deltaproteobacteria bacterium]TMB27597.1 MAG: MmcQ/YjbR family DNA-binding protein [Deltaproteobacteria bacterium]